MTKVLVSFFVLLILITLALIFSYRRLVSLREKTFKVLRNNFVYLRELKKKILSVKKGYESYSLYEFEPYEKLLVQLYENLSNLGKSYLAVWRLQRERLNEFFKYKPRRILGSEKLRFFFEKKRWDNILDIEQKTQNQLQSIFRASENAERLLEKVDDLPRVTALRVIDVVNNLTEISIKLDLLQDKGVQGETFNVHLQKYQLMEVEKEKIPENFYNGQQTKFKNLIIVTIAAYQIVKSIANECQKLLNNVRTWHISYQQCEDITGKTRVILRNMQIKLQEMPKTLDVSTENKLADDISNQFAVVTDEFKKPTVEEISVLINKAEKIGQEGQSLLDTLNKLEEQNKRLSTLIENASNRTQLLQAGFQSQAGQFRYPVKWNVSQKKLEDLFQKIEDIGSIDHRRNLLRVEDDLKKIAIVDVNIRELENVYSTIIGQAKELRDSWEETKRIYRFEWSRKAQDLAQKVKIYSPENWNPKVHVTTLVRDANELTQRAQQNIPENDHVQIIESSLPNLLKEIRKLTADIRTYEQNQVQIEQIYDFTVDEERRAKKILGNNLPWIHKIVKEVNRWDLATEWVKNIYEAGNEGEILQTQINNRDAGVVKTKSDKIQKWERNAQEQSKLFQDKITRDLNAGENRLSFLLATLDEIGKIKDKEINSARGLLVKPAFAFDVPMVGTNLVMQNTYEEIKKILARRSAVFQGKESVENVASTLIANFEAVKVRRTHAHSLKQQAIDQFTRDWPPVSRSVDLSYEASWLKNIDEDIADYKNQKQTVANLENIYINIRDKLNTVILRIEEKINDDKNDQEHFISLEKNVINKLNLRIKEVVTFNSEYALTDSQLYRLKESGLSIIKDIKQNYRENKIDALEARDWLENLFHPNNTSIDLRSLHINSGGGPIIAGTVDNRYGHIVGRTGPTPIDEIH